jgi:hypothetical protein
MAKVALRLAARAEDVPVPLRGMGVENAAAIA